ncbi:MAG: phospholipid scramblase-related protein [Acidimicrobiales bacterium]|nr:phospholipid scramblase-related protein [Acidimicrobiales bacterium]
MSDQSTSSGEHEAGWYADPMGRGELRYFDGSSWTEHISTKGEQQVDPFGTDEKMTEGLGDYLLSGANASKFTMNRPQWTGTGHLFTEPVLVVKQQGRIGPEIAANYEIESHDGTRLGSVRQVGQSQAKQLVRAFTKWDKHMSHTFEVLDAEGNVVLSLHRPAKLVKSKITISDGSGNEIGKVVQENAFRKIRFDLQVNDTSIGQIRGTNWRDWNFVIYDPADEEIGRVTKSFEGIAQALMGGDSFVVAMHKPLEDPLRQLVVAAGVCIDTALHMDE